MTEKRQRLSLDFWKFWTGQVISVLGSSFSQFAIPLLVFKLTHSAVNLALTMAVSMLPYLFFGLVIGAWVDRLDRKRLMIVVNVLLALVVSSVPLMAAVGHLSIWWIYGAIFVEVTLSIFFSSAEFAAIPSLVGQDDLVTANGRIQASYSAAMVIGPILAGGLSAFISLPDLFVVDAVSFLLAGATLFTIRAGFNHGEPQQRRRVREDIVEGLRYVLGHPVLRNISLMMAMVNFVGSTTGAQLVLYAKDRLGASNYQIGILFAAEGAGMVIFSLLAGRLRRRWSFSRVALGSLIVGGALTLVFSLVPWFWLATPVFLVEMGVMGLFNIQTSSLRQAIVPNHMLGRVMSIAGVLAWSAIPLGALLGAAAIQWTHNVALVYGVIGVVTMVIPFIFSFTALGHADDYLPGAEEAPAAAQTG